MKFRKLLSLLMVVAMVLSVLAMAGCGDKKTTGNGGSTDGAQSEEDFFADMPNELRGTKVQFATWIDHNSTDTANTLRSFEKETGMKIEIVAVPQGSYIPKLNSLVAADEAPDVLVDNGEFPNTLRLLQPLSWEENCVDPKDPFWDQGISELYKVGKNYYLVRANYCTFDMGGYFVLYNSTIMEENGIKTPKEYVAEDNWNLETLVTTLRQLKQRVYPDSVAGSINVHGMMDMMGTAEIPLNRETGLLENGLKTDKALEAIQWCIKYKDEGLISVWMEGGSWAGALTLGGAYALRNKPGWFYESNWDDFDMVQCPKINKDDAEYPKTGSTRGYGIMKGAKNPKGAGYFLRFFLNGDNYDLNEVYKNQECVEMWQWLNEHNDYKDADFQYGCRKIVDPEAGSVVSGMMATLIKTSYAQIGTELSKTQNTVDAAVNKGNEIIKEVIAAQG